MNLPWLCEIRKGSIVRQILKSSWEIESRWDQTAETLRAEKSHSPQQSQ